MLLKREGFPEEDTFVLCTITNIHYHSVFAKLDEYGKTGLIHISEISPGRIRNIRDFVVEGKKVVCKVLKIDREKGHIDLSLRRVNDNQKRIKISEIKQEQKAEKIIEQVAKHLKKDVSEIYNDVSAKIAKRYDDLTACFKEAAQKPELLESLGIDKHIADELQPIIAVRFHEEEIAIHGMLKLNSVEPDGVEIIKKCLQEAKEVDKKVEISYAGGGMYHMSIRAEDYKTGERILNSAVEKALEIKKQGKGIGEFQRKE